MYTKIQKTILGAPVLKFQFYKMETFKAGRRQQITKGFIWFSNGTSIRIQGSRFSMVLRNNRILGYLGNSMRAYRQIKRMIATWFKPYINHRIFKYGDGYFIRKFPNKIFHPTVKHRMYERTA